MLLCIVRRVGRFSLAKPSKLEGMLCSSGQKLMTLNSFSRSYGLNGYIFSKHFSFHRHVIIDLVGQGWAQFAILVLKASNRYRWGEKHGWLEPLTQGEQESRRCVAGPGSGGGWAKRTLAAWGPAGPAPSSQLLRLPGSSKSWFNNWLGRGFP